MERCETCGNNYEDCFSVEMNGKKHKFDSFECAIEALAPKCAHCGCRIIGHGVKASSQFFCCDHCARHSTNHKQKTEHRNSFTAKDAMDTKV